VCIRDFGQYEKTRGDVQIPGLNSKMQEFSAIVGLSNLQKVDFILNERKKNILRYVNFFDTLKSQGYLNVMKVQPNIECTYLYFPIILNEDATEFVKYMVEKEIAVRRYYTATHDLKYYKDKYRNQNLDFTNTIKDKIVSLPIFTTMSNDELDYIFTNVENFFKK
jgi:dTDP-4-amino-4,6-dideoxygalactose transaminase